MEEQPKLVMPNEQTIRQIITDFATYFDDHNINAVDAYFATKYTAQQLKEKYKLVEVGQKK